MAKSDDKQTKMFGGNVPKMPEGYYSGDKPNPNLRAFVEQHIKEQPYDPENDDYNVPAFDKPIETTKATAIYNMHTYWSKKPHDAIREYIRHYTKPGDLVLDPFCGSGGTALAALIEGRKAIAIDRSPAATFITKNYCTPVDVDELQKAFEEVQRKVKPEIDWLYETRCDRCGGRAITTYTVYSQVFQCPRCLEKVPFFDCVEVEGETAKGKPKKISVCPNCHKKGIVEDISTRAEKFGGVPVLTSYLCKSGCRPARGERRHNDPIKKKCEYFENYDIEKIQEIEAKDIPHWYPTIDMVKGHETCVKRNLAAQGVHKVCDLFTKRNLWALAAYFSELRNVGMCKDALKFSFTSILLKSSRMMAHNNDGIGRIQKGTYYIPQNIHDIHVGQFMAEAVNDMLIGYKAMGLPNSQLIITTSDARDINIPDCSVDYIFTDPPYADKVQYGELNFVWEVWLGFDAQWLDEEIIVNAIRGKTEEDWTNMMRQAMAECYRVLKQGRCLSLCYHDTSEGTWALMQDLMAETGFIVEKTDSALFIDSKTKTTNQYFADKVNKRDLVINFRKQKPGEVIAAVAITGDEDETTFNEKVRQIIRENIAANPGSTKDRIYDEVVSRMVRSGQMEAHNFEEILRQVADEVKTPVMKNLFEQKDPDLFGTHERSRWYLKETELEVSDAAESAKEHSAAENLDVFMLAYLQKNKAEEGVHYSDLWERYVYMVKDKPRRQLAEWLPDYFYKTEMGTWRPPASEEEAKIKADGRSKGTGRRVKRYLSLLEQGVAIPENERPNDATLAEWIRHCKRSGLFEQGKLLYEKGGLELANLPEEAMVAVDEDYQVCVRMLGRSGSGVENRPKRGRKKVG